ncbi:hypothetical protein [Kaistia granuli]|uniref:hypothetical protein n=1 Tax=Kaistia granuli TaxID=363259 RepID=UPI0012EC100E|nr:hypothetical protein [Kaistia granuli]
MFFIKGWVPLSDVAHALAVRRRLEHNEMVREANAARRRLLDTIPDYRVDIWRICDAAPRVGILLPHGRVIDASRRLVKWPGIPGTSNRFMDLMVGTVGSSEWVYDDEDPVTQDELTRQFGPFLHFPILLSEVCMEMATGKRPIPSGDDLEEAEFDDQSPRQIAKQIVAAVDAGVVMSRSEFQAEHAPGSGRVFRLAWEIATAERPQLSRPGRKRNLP